MGESSKVRRFSIAAPRTNSPAETTVNASTKLRVSSPAGSARFAVRGLAASNSASTRRLNAIAADRALTMQTIIHASTRAGGHPPAASTAPVSANGRAKIECSHLIISSVMRVLRSAFSIRPHYRRPMRSLSEPKAAAGMNSEAMPAVELLMLRSLTGHLEVVDHRKHARHAVGPDARDVLVALAVHHAGKHHVSAVDNNSYWLRRIDRVAVQLRSAIHSALFSATNPVIHR